MPGRSNRKTSKCLNCGEKLKPSFEYCPKCGQENSDLQLTFLQMIRDFVTNYFALDSRFGRSFKPFFIRPGFLTEEFMKGKRMSYANPIRLYIVISVIHFFIFSIYFNDGDSTNTNVERSVLRDTTFLDESGNEVVVFKGDTVKFDVQADADNSLAFSENNFAFRFMLIQNMADELNATEIYDSLRLENKGYLTQLMWKQIIKLSMDGVSSLGRYFLKNIPILMFFLLPVYALILKIFFSNGLYINHVVHSIHLHSFVFLILTLLWLFAMLFNSSPWAFGITFLLLYFYIIQSFRKTYQIGLKKSVFSVLWTGSLYGVVILISLAFTFVISFLLF